MCCKIWSIIKKEMKGSKSCKQVFVENVRGGGNLYLPCLKTSTDFICLSTPDDGLADNTTVHYSISQDCKLQKVFRVQGNACWERRVFLNRPVTTGGNCTSGLIPREVKIKVLPHWVVFCMSCPLECICTPLNLISHNNWNRRWATEKYVCIHVLVDVTNYYGATYSKNKVSPEIVGTRRAFCYEKRWNTKCETNPIEQWQYLIVYSKRFAKYFDTVLSEIHDFYRRK